ncbi:MAG: hypothetical protein SVM80_10090 [Halobacteriota archaeon]|nr:hypothetical protein [Halobacteriota archaeon]
MNGIERKVDIPLKYLDYLGRARVGVVGGGILIKMLQKWGFKEIVVLERNVQEEQLYMDPFYHESDLGSFPTYQTLLKSEVTSYPLPDSIQGIKSKLKGIDIVIGCYEQEKAALASEELGAPFITSGIVCTVLPEGIKFSELLIPELKTNISLTTVIRAVQSLESVKVISGFGEPVFAPYGIEIDMINHQLKKIRLDVNKK